MTEEGNVNYIFFDIETILLDTDHVPYLIVSHKVCNVCLELKANHNQGKNCGQRETIFKGKCLVRYQRLLPLAFYT